MLDKIKNPYLFFTRHGFKREKKMDVDQSIT
jgi:hypothetical protein